MTQARVLRPCKVCGESILWEPRGGSNRITCSKEELVSLAEFYSGVAAQEGR